MTDDPPEIYVRMGELALGRSPTILKATLGSCIGIAFLWRERGLFALAHCLLAWAPEPCMPSGARYVDQAISSLLRMLEAKPGDYAQLEAHLAGGGNMSQHEASDNRTPMVGQLNIEAALQVLQTQGIRVHSQDMGGIHARRMRLDCAKGSVRVEYVPRP